MAEARVRPSRTERMETFWKRIANVLMASFRCVTKGPRSTSKERRSKPEIAEPVAATEIIMNPINEEHSRDRRYGVRGGTPARLQGAALRCGTGSQRARGGIRARRGAHMITGAIDA
jgi:hypothetical protein